MRAVTELSSIDDLSRIRVTWKRLWDQCPEASFFQSWDWLSAQAAVQSLPLQSELLGLGTQATLGLTL